MKHSQKMILIPEKNLENYLRQQRLTTPATVTKMAQLDEEMKSVLDRIDTSQDEKAKTPEPNFRKLPPFQSKTKCGKN